jgi:ribosomal protein S18 acetylase RimI-like enzyme
MTASPITLRAATVADMAAVGDIDARITGTAKPQYGAEMFERFGRRDDRFFLLAEADDGVAGYVAGEVRAWEFGSPPCGWVFVIGVDPAARGRKVATLLFQALCKAMESRGVDTIRTMIACDDELNMAFFRAQGMMGGPFIELEMPLSQRGEWERDE